MRSPNRRITVEFSDEVNIVQRGGDSLHYEVLVARAPGERRERAGLKRRGVTAASVCDAAWAGA